MSEAPAPEAWQLAASEAASEPCHLQPPAPPWPLSVLKSSQLDAARLDDELLSMLHEQFMRVFALLPQGHVTDVEPELQAVLLLLVFCLSVGQGRATPGSALLNLRYRNEHAVSSAPQLAGRTGVEGPGLGSAQRTMYGVGYVMVPYLWARLSRAATQRGWGDRDGDVAGQQMWRCMRWLEGGYRVAAALNLLDFLRTGKYRSVLERILSARLVYRQPTMSRVISFEYLNRQLVWQELSELLLFLLPLLNVARLKQAVARFMPYLPNPATIAAGMAGFGTASSSSKDAGAASGDSAGSTAHGTSPGSALQDSAGMAGAVHRSTEAAVVEHPSGPCPVCRSEDVLIPYVAVPCGHVFCYYCLRASCVADPGSYRCPVDGVTVSALRRWSRHRKGS